MKKLTLAQGMTFPRFAPGRKSPLLTSAEDMNALIMDPLECLYRMEIQQGNDTTGKVIISDKNFILQLPLNPQSNPPTTSSGGGLSWYRLHQVMGDYLICRTWDGSVEGLVDVVIAKPFKLRNSITTETKMGVTHVYTYTTTGVAVVDSNGIVNATRHDTDGTTNEDQRVVPVWLFADLIYAMQTPPMTVYDPVAAPSGITATLVMVGESRQWAGPI